MTELTTKVSYYYWETGDCTVHVSSLPLLGSDKTSMTNNLANIISATSKVLPSNEQQLTVTSGGGLYSEQRVLHACYFTLAEHYQRKTGGTIAIFSTKLKIYDV